MGRKYITNTYALAAISCTGGLLFGFDISSLSAILSTQNYQVYFSNTPIITDPVTGWRSSSGPDSDLQGGITASMAGGSFLGALASGPLSDRIGRRNSIATSMAIWIVGSILACAAQSTAMLIVARIVLGFAIGIASSVVPTYISELAKPEVRGRLTSLQQWSITWGILIFYFISYGCSFIGQQDGRSTASWRTPWGLQMVPAILVLAVVPFMPRSPRWLASRGHMDEAHEVLALIHGEGNRQHPLVLAELEEIKQSLADEATGSYAELIQGNHLNRLHISLFTQIWSQLSGMNVMMYYIGFVAQMAGLNSGNVTMITNSIQYVINVIMTIPALIYLDSWGRRPTLLVGSSLMALWLFTVAGLMAAHGEPYTPDPSKGDPDAVRWKVHGPATKGIIAASYLFVASFASTFGPVSWTYPPELWNNRLRSKAVSLATAANWAVNFALGYFVPPAFKNIVWRTYLIFGIFCVVMTVHIFLAFPETRRLSLEEVDELFASGRPAWRTRGFVGEGGTKVQLAAAKIGDGLKPAEALAEAEMGREPSDLGTPDEKKEIA
ncbi:high affinity glucose transporter [Tilletia horrida]|uniref:High affinity glucose transporter n=1 Tax=Tilletia horrida TaxID=155126 RepID=A0AAN6G8D8_9BASI|nr:high affinity glucose transporter [Tilletia horrida]KAK0532598.1 high affinity glucose transporter [Tilletia horrida]KAK0537824.1 high affinity glucose transporter [Tilletia horrida]KAK0559237.1 high affinity glucose transporter [Tilletia horrida]